MRQTSLSGEAPAPKAVAAVVGLIDQRQSADEQYEPLLDQCQAIASSLLIAAFACLQQARILLISSDKCSASMLQ